MQLTRGIGKYRIKSLVGAGGFGTVYLVEHEGREFALKQLEIGVMNPEISKRFILESKRIEKLRGQYNLGYIIQIYDILYEHNAYVMEYIPESSEEYFEKKVDEDFISNLIRAFSQLHQLGVVHRDIKPKNLRVKDSQPLIIDFGVTSWWDSRSSMTRVATKFYSPPEVVVGVFNDYRDSEAARRAQGELLLLEPDNAIERFRLTKRLHDVYSLGLTIGELLTGKHPFTPESYSEYLRAGRLADFDAWLREIPPRFKEFVERSTAFSPLRRLQLDDLVQRLNIEPLAFPGPLPVRDDETYCPDSYVKCLKCSKEVLPPADYCPLCDEGLTTMMLHIEPLQDTKTKILPGSLRLVPEPAVEDGDLSLVIDLEGSNFEIVLGRDIRPSDISFPHDNWMSRAHGRLIKEGNKVYYIDGKDNKQPTNPGLFNNLPIGNSRVELASGAHLLLGSTVFKIKKYFGKIK
ncbi:MAG: hypothetical protein KAW12_27165 [Candidatus Aminicenantes bacterium]|nr:hypothetical protein [Candidatus Aminicenantes bacterium]